MTLRNKALAAFGLALAGTGATAADLPVMNLRPTMTPVAEHDWSGAYLGVHAGLARGRSEAEEYNTISDPTNTDYCSTTGGGRYVCNLNGQPHPISSPYSSFNGIGDKWSMPIKGSVAGGTLGYNFQRGAFVYGVEADYGYLDLRGRSGPSPLSLDDTFLHTDATDYMTARLRLGYAYDRLLVFATGGVANAHFNSWVDDPDMKVGVKTEKTNLQWGYAFGAGAEFALTDRITVKGDWLRLGFNKAPTTGYVNITCTSDGCPADWKLSRAGMAGDGNVGWKVRHMVNLFRFGVNYKF